MFFDSIPKFRQKYKIFFEVPSFFEIFRKKCRKKVVRYCLLDIKTPERHHSDFSRGILFMCA